VNRELETAVRLSSEPHPNIVRFLGHWTEGRVLFLVMDFYPDTLAGVLERLAVSEYRMKAARMTVLMRQLALALAHLEQIGLMHRDLKPENVLLCVHSDRLALADFGSAKFVEPGKPNTTYMCTRFYRAPELILDRSIYSCSVDIWAFGCVLAELAHGAPLFTGDTQVEVMSSIIRVRGMVTVDDIAHMPTHAPESIGDLAGIGTGCVGRPWSRVFTRRVRDRRVNTSYGASYESALDGCLQWNPASRLSASDLSRHPAWCPGPP
jgi:glycogen synthase kinase 3 beta